MKTQNSLSENTFSSKSFGNFSIVTYHSWDNVDILFEDTGTLVRGLYYANIKRGEVKDPCVPNVNGTFIGQGYDTKLEVGNYKVYNLWNSILKRTVRPNKSQASYENQTLHKDWYCFQGFAEWFLLNIPKVGGLQLDKDLLVKGNREYGPETCTFLPVEVNKMLENSKAARGDCPVGVSRCKKRYRAYHTPHKAGKSKHLGIFNTKQEAFNVYKIHREKEIKRVADLNRHLISNKAYEALLRYEVAIED